MNVFSRNKWYVVLMGLLLLPIFAFFFAHIYGFLFFNWIPDENKMATCFFILVVGVPVTLITKLESR